MTSLRQGRLPISGADLFYRVSGAGSHLLLLAGGSGDADSMDGLATELARDFTVITYDRRGYARSPLDEPLGDGEIVTIETQSADAASLLSALTDGEKSFIFGSSLGALIGLDLVLRHSALAATLVAHEPPLLQLLTPEERGAPHSERGRQKGVEERMKAFAASIGIKHLSSVDATDRPERARAKITNAAFFLAHEAGAVRGYQVDFDQLRSLPCHIDFAGGEAGRMYFPYICAKRAASCMGAEVIDLPGHHAGYVQYPTDFASRLRALLASSASPLRD